MPVRPFRFVAAVFTADSAEAWAERARRVETLGYDTLGIGDHFAADTFASVPALMAAAAATTTIRIACTSFANDLRHPALLAKEAAALDVLSGGRLDVGIGAGWAKWEYDQLGVPFAPPGVRVGRLEEAVRILKGLWSGAPFAYEGTHYAVNAPEGVARSLQRPHPPLFIGGGGRRVLALAAREADIIGLIAQAEQGGGLALASDSETLLAEKVGWVREAAGERFTEIELAMLIWGVAVTDQPRKAAEALGRGRGLSAEQVLASPYFLIGTVDAITERLRELRERYGVSHISVMPPYVDAFAPVVAHLTGR